MVQSRHTDTTTPVLYYYYYKHYCRLPILVYTEYNTGTHTAPSSAFGVRPFSCLPIVWLCPGPDIYVVSVSRSRVHIYVPSDLRSVPFVVIAIGILVGLSSVRCTALHVRSSSFIQLFLPTICHLHTEYPVLLVRYVLVSYVCTDGIYTINGYQYIDTMASSLRTPVFEVTDSSSRAECR